MMQIKDEKINTPSGAIIRYGRKLYPTFNLDNSNQKEVYQKVYYGITGDKHYYLLDVEPSKGILLYGPNLIGKTVLFQVMQRMFEGTPVHFGKISLLDIRKKIESAKYKHATIKEIFNSYGKNKKQDLYIDDIAYKKDENGVWKEVRDIISDIIHERHELFISEGYKTHVSTDTIPVSDAMESKDQPTLKSIYGERTFNRIKILTSAIEWTI